LRGFEDMRAAEAEARCCADDRRRLVCDCCIYWSVLRLQIRRCEWKIVFNDTESGGGIKPKATLLDELVLAERDGDVERAVVPGVYC